MSEYIERGALLELETFLQDADGFECSAVLSVDIRSAKAADVVEVKHGRWVRLDAHKGIEQFKCSVCRSECYVPTCMNDPMYAYCPNCGCKMDGKGEGE